MIQADRDEPPLSFIPLVLVRQSHRIVEDTRRVGEANAVLQKVRLGFGRVPHDAHVCTICISRTAVNSCRPDVPLDCDLMRSAAVIAWEHRIAVYAAVYVALAERTGFPLLTADEAMAKKLEGHGSVARLGSVELS